MSTFSRRSFFHRTAAGLTAATAWKLGADPLGLPLGFQTYPIREMLVKDFPGTLKQMASLGYKSVEMCSPQGYDDFKALANLKPQEIRDTIQSAGLRCESSHYTPGELKTNLDERIAFAKALGLKQMICSMMALPKNATLDDWKKGADELNKTAETVHKAGLQFGYHNHHFEFKKFGDVLVYDELMKRFDPKLVKMQFQVAVISIGYEAATYLNKYPGRFISLHLADWSPQAKKNVAVGKGIVGWPKLFAAAKTAGVKNYYVEMDLEEMKGSVPYLKGLKS